MGKLGDFIAGRKKKFDKPAIHEIESRPTPYNRIWLSNIASKNGYTISDNDKQVDGILMALNSRSGHCPCGGMTEDFICPCKMMREHGACKCGLYKEAKDINPHGGTSVAEIKQ